MQAGKAVLPSPFPPPALAKYSGAQVANRCFQSKGGKRRGCRSGLGKARLYPPARLAQSRGRDRARRERGAVFGIGGKRKKSVLRSQSGAVNKTGY